MNLENIVLSEMNPSTLPLGGPVAFTAAPALCGWRPPWRGHPAVLATTSLLICSTPHSVSVVLLTTLRESSSARPSPVTGPPQQRRHSGPLARAQPTDLGKVMSSRLSHGTRLGRPVLCALLARLQAHLFNKTRSFGVAVCDGGRRKPQART